MAERGSDQHGPRLDDDLHDDTRWLALPAGRTFQNVQEVWVALGGMVEHRF
jgi:hypothetical protein